jgi:hypothetical protein
MLTFVVKKINIEKNYWTCGVFNSLNIKFFVSLNAIFLFLGTLTCAFRAQFNMALIYKLVAIADKLTLFGNSG